MFSQLQANPLLALVILISSGLSDDYDVGLSEVDLEQLNEEYEDLLWILGNLQWQHSTNMSSESGNRLRDFQEVYSTWMKKVKMRARITNTKGMHPRYRRMVKLLLSGVVFSDQRTSRAVSIIRTRLSRIYAEGRVFIPSSTVILRGEDGAESLMKSTRDPNVLADVWRQWQLSVGRPIRSPFVQMVKLLNEGAVQNGYENYGDVWKEDMEMQDVEQEALSLWENVQELYSELHSYVRRQLYEFYGPLHLNISGAIPIHLLGSLWGYNWKHLAPLVLPFPNIPPPPSLEDLAQKPEDMVYFAEDYCASMGLPRMTPTFWKKSFFVRPSDDRTFDCHSSAVDFQKADDFRMKACFSPGNVDDLNVVFHELGHILYFMAYRHQPAFFRNAPNAAFHEAIGDALASSALAPRCILGNATYEQELNYLMTQALTKVTILPWALILDVWRYGVFKGVVRVKNLNSDWWKLRQMFQGVKPPDNGQYGDFDPGTKYHVAEFMPYMKYFFSHFLQFDFLDALCSSRDQAQLSQCCLRGNKEAGRDLWKMMSLGSSKPWPEVLHILTGKRRITSASLKRYFQPLFQWLKKTNHGSQRQNTK